MRKLGDLEPRSLHSFGVSGLLGEECKIYYGSVVRGEGLGRVGDLVVAQIVDIVADPLELRELIYGLLIECHRCEQEAGENVEEPIPAMVEIGIDREKVAIGVSFIAPGKYASDLEGVRNRLNKNKPGNSLERAIYLGLQKSEQVVFRYQEDIQRVELDILIMLNKSKRSQALEEMEEADLADRVEWIVFPKDPPESSPEATEIIELGDLDYAALLAEKDPESALPASPAGEFLSKAYNELEEALRVRGQKRESEAEARRIKGERADKEQVTRVSGSGGVDADTTKLTVAGGSGPGGSGDRIVVSGGDALKIAEYEEKIKRLEAELNQVRTASANAAANHAVASETKISAFSGLIKKLMPFGGKQNTDDDDDELAEMAASAEPSESGAEGESADGDEVAPSKKAKGKKKATSEEAEDGGEDAADGGTKRSASDDQDVENLMVELEGGGLERTISKAQKEASEIKKELSSSRAKRWVDGLMGELVSEKARLNDMAKKLSHTMRQKEHEMRAKETLLQEELKRRDEAIRQKTNTLARTKEQVTQLTMSMERLKSAQHSAVDDVHFKQKYQLSQKLLSAAKDENGALQSKVDELKVQLVSAKAGVGSRAQSSQEHANLQVKHDRLARQVEEYKKTNQQLLDKLGEKDRKDRGGGNEDVKKRLEAAMKLAAVNQKESEIRQLRVEELQREEARLKAELQRALNEIRTLKADRVVA